MKKSWVIVMFCVLALGGIFIWIVLNSPIVGDGGFADSSDKIVEGENEGVVGLDIVNEAYGGSPEEEDENVVESSDCVIRQVQYSLKNFKEESLCLENFDGRCLTMLVNCSVEIYNFDDGIDDVFEVLYSLSYGEEGELDSELVTGDVAMGEHQTFSAEFVWEDDSGISGDLSCPFIMNRIPRKTVC